MNINVDPMVTKLKRMEDIEMRSTNIFWYWC